jgi:hypothetical protein
MGNLITARVFSEKWLENLGSLSSSRHTVLLSVFNQVNLNNEYQKL